MQNKLLPCPFCSKGFRRNCRGAYEHENGECILHGLEIYNEKQLEKWNTRKPMERIVEQLEEELTDIGSKTGYHKGITKAIEIVRNGGKE